MAVFDDVPEKEYVARVVDLPVAEYRSLLAEWLDHYVAEYADYLNTTMRDALLRSADLIRRVASGAPVRPEDVVDWEGPALAAERDDLDAEVLQGVGEVAFFGVLEIVEGSVQRTASGFLRFPPWLGHTDLEDGITGPNTEVPLAEAEWRDQEARYLLDLLVRHERANR